MNRRSYRELITAVLPFHQSHPEKFKKFYDRISVLLGGIPPGGALLISEHCHPRSLSLFMDVAEMVIIEDMVHRDWRDGILEFSDDMKWIKRSISLRPRKPLFKLYNAK